eukprot:5949044-Pyramimonas_sp.AAC.1
MRCDDEWYNSFLGQLLMHVTLALERQDRCEARLEASHRPLPPLPPPPLPSSALLILLHSPPPPPPSPHLPPPPPLSSFRLLIL